MTCSHRWRVRSRRSSPEWIVTRYIMLPAQGPHAEGMPARPRLRGGTAHPAGVRPLYMCWAVPLLDADDVAVALAVLRVAGEENPNWMFLVGSAIVKVTEPPVPVVPVPNTTHFLCTPALPFRVIASPATPLRCDGARRSGRQRDDDCGRSPCLRHAGWWEASHGRGQHSRHLRWQPRCPRQTLPPSRPSRLGPAGTLELPAWISFRSGPRS